MRAAFEAAGLKRCTQCGVVQLSRFDFTPVVRGWQKCSGICKTCRNAALRAETVARGPLPPRPKPDWRPRFWSKVQKTETCWLWTGVKNNHGYGHFSSSSRLVYAHRVALEESLGRSLDPTLSVDHLCRTPSCVRPDHLELVTQAENSRRGLRARLTKPDVVDIRHRRALGDDATSLAREFGVSRGHVDNIVARRRVWIADMDDAQSLLAEARR